MEIEAISKCRICGNSDLKVVLDLGIHTLSGRFPKIEEDDPPHTPLVLLKCNNQFNKENCGLLQLAHGVPPDEMYRSTYGYRSGINNSMVEHLRKLADEAKSKVNLKEGDVVLDIGSNDGTLLSFYDSGLETIGIDPTAEQFRKYYPKNVKVVEDYFNLDKFLKISDGKKAKIITSIAMIYDLPKPIEFFRDIKAALHPEGVWVFEQSYMPTMLTMNSFDTICHEHLEYYTLHQIKWLLDKVGLRAIDVSLNDCNGGSFRVTVAHAGPTENYSKEVNNLLSEEESLGLDSFEPYSNFKDKVSGVRRKLIQFIQEEKSAGKKIYGYGASTKGNTLLQYFGIGKESISLIADKNPEKWDRCTPRTRIPIIPEEKARADNPDYFLVLPWHFKDNFISREQEYLSNGGKFIFPLPEFQIIGGSGGN